VEEDDVIEDWRAGVDRTVEDVMVEAAAVAPETPFRVLVEKLWVQGSSGLPVVDGKDRVVGIVSDTDLLPGMREHRAGHEAMPARSRAVDRTAADVMSSSVVTVGHDASLTHAAALMHVCGMERLPVVDPTGRLIGMVGRANLLRAFLRSDDVISRHAREALQRVLLQPGTVVVSVVEGIVILEGEVATRPEAEAVVRCVEGLPGVIGVEDRLRAPT
jgi:CBS-domain-containing membrane protein